MTTAQWGTAPTPPCGIPSEPQGLTATGGRRSVSLTWQASAPASGYHVYYDQAGKHQLIAEVNANATSYFDNRLNRQVQYCYVVGAWNDCDANGTYDVGVDTESLLSGVACATTK